MLICDCDVNVPDVIRSVKAFESIVFFFKYCEQGRFNLNSIVSVSISFDFYEKTKKKQKLNSKYSSSKMNSFNEH